MKKKLLILLLVLGILTVGCSKKEEKNNTKETTKSKEISYSCYREDKNVDGGTTICKQVVILDKDNHFKTYKIINDDTFTTDEMYKASKERVENNVKEHNEKYADQYKWELETEDKTKHIVSTRIYDMSEVKDGTGHEYESEYKHFKQDGAYEAEGWMKDKENSKSTCQKD